jgi:uncharacterized membrane protein YfcA
MINELLLAFCGVFVGIIAVVLGGANFWAIPVFQILFPGLGYGVLVGNLKVGSVWRGVASSITTWRQISLKRVLWISILMAVGTLVGASVTSKLDQRWILAGVILAAIVCEFAEWFSKRATPAHFTVGAILIGAWYGFFGAGFGILVVSLMRVRISDDSKIAEVKSDARVIELFLSIVAVIAHFASGNIVNSLWIPWSVGSVIGGFIGGAMLNRLGKVPASVQKTVLRISYLLAIAVCFFTRDF